jgi:hypothetical protein
LQNHSGCGRYSISNLSSANFQDFDESSSLQSFVENAGTPVANNNRAAEVGHILQQAKLLSARNVRGISHLFQREKEATRRLD